MQKAYESLHKNTNALEPSPDLFNKIMKRIQQEQKVNLLKRAKIKLLSAVVVAFLMAGSLVPVWVEFQTEMNQSGFSQFLSLLFSDINAVFAYWQDFIFSLLESLPVVTLTLMLSILFIFLLSFKFTLQNLKILLSARALNI